MTPEEAWSRCMELGLMPRMLLVERGLDKEYDQLKQKIITSIKTTETFANYMAQFDRQILSNQDLVISCVNLYNYLNEDKGAIS